MKSTNTTRQPKQAQDRQKVKSLFTTTAHQLKSDIRYEEVWGKCKPSSAGADSLVEIGRAVELLQRLIIEARPKDTIAWATLQSAITKLNGVNFRR